MSELPAVYGCVEANDPSHFKPLPRNRLSGLLRNQIASHILGCSDRRLEGFALYTLSDPRDIRSPRYIGQTGSPGRRWSQHVNTARLWMPDEMPWWVKSPKLRPLYDWIRTLHRDGYRLPFMHVTDWVDSSSEARERERRLILVAMKQGMPLLNVEATSRPRRTNSAP